MAFLAETTDNDAELIAYLHRLAGYILTGSTREQSFTFIYGTGGNGKSVFIDTLLHVLGDYGRTAPMSVFMAKGRNEHPTELAGLQGARLVAANETNTNGAWDEARLKILSGGDRIAARFMRGDYYEYTPNFKLVVVGNVKPTFSSVDAATRRRLHLVSFEHTPLVPDRDLLDKLRLESPGILAWMIEGCLAWQEEGLNPPRAVLKATKEYLDDQDLLGRWMSDCCHIGPEYREQSSKLFDSFTTWCGESREVALSQRQFVMQLKARGFPKYQDSRDRGLRGLKGLALREFESSAEGASLAAEEAA
jgi:P4 family phage/plasmid primase-like protien